MRRLLVSLVVGFLLVAAVASVADATVGGGIPLPDRATAVGGGIPLPRMVAQ